MIIASFKNLWTVGKALFDGFGQNLKGIGQLFLGAFTFDLDKIKEGLANIKDAAVDTVTDIVDGISDNYGEALENAFSPKDKIELVTEEGLQQGIDDMLDPIKKGWGSLKDMFSFKGGAGTSGAGATTPAKVIEDAGDAAEEAEPKVNKLKDAFNSLKQNVDVVGLMVNELGNAFETIFTHQINAALGDTEQSFQEMTSSVICRFKAVSNKAYSGSRCSGSASSFISYGRDRWL